VASQRRDESEQHPEMGRRQTSEINELLLQSSQRSRDLFFDAEMASSLLANCRRHTMVSLGRPLAFCSFYARSASSLLVSRRPFLVSSGLVASSFASAATPNTKTVCSMSSQASDAVSTGFLNAEDAAALDVELMSSPGFSLEQLMELAGLSVAEAVYQVVPPESSAKKKILIVCGPGNNGGDGLVAARHLVMFGYECVVVYPKQSSKQHFVNLVRQCQDVGIPVLEEMPNDLLASGDYSALVDSIFGFSFHGTLREPFGTIMAQLKEAQETLKIPAISVDIPSGWNVNGGDEANTGFKPDVLISLTAPKLAAKSFTGRHFIGGRFVPPKLSKKYNIQVRKEMK